MTATTKKVYSYAGWIMDTGLGADCPIPCDMCQDRNRVCRKYKENEDLVYTLGSAGQKCASCRVMKVPCNVTLGGVGAAHRHRHRGSRSQLESVTEPIAGPSTKSTEPELRANQRPFSGRGSQHKIRINALDGLAGQELSGDGSATRSNSKAPSTGDPTNELTIPNGILTGSGPATSDLEDSLIADQGDDVLDDETSGHIDDPIDDSMNNPVDDPVRDSSIKPAIMSDTLLDDTVAALPDNVSANSLDERLKRKEARIDEDATAKQAEIERKAKRKVEEMEQWILDVKNMAREESEELQATTDEKRRKLRENHRRMKNARFAELAAKTALETAQRALEAAQAEWDADVEAEQT